MNTTILYIEDEIAIAETILAYSKREGFEVDHFCDGRSGLEAFCSHTYSLVILDWMLPEMSGPEILKKIREQSEIPVLMLSARDDESDVVLALELGANDYVRKPFGPREVMVRIKKLLTLSSQHELKNVITQGVFILSSQEMICTKNGVPIDLTMSEFRLLEIMISEPNHVFRREYLMEHALGYRDFLFDRTLDTHIKNLRQKIGDSPTAPQYIQTMRGIGFRWITQDI